MLNDKFHCTLSCKNVNWLSKTYNMRRYKEMHVFQIFSIRLSGDFVKIQVYKKKKTYNCSWRKKKAVSHLTEEMTIKNKLKFISLSFTDNSIPFSWKNNEWKDKKILFENFHQTLNHFELILMYTYIWKKWSDDFLMRGASKTKGRCQTSSLQKCLKKLNILILRQQRQMMIFE